MSNSQNIALLVVDMQAAYFKNTALRDQQHILSKNTNQLILLARQNHFPIFNVRTEHQTDIATWTLNMRDDKQGYLFKGDTDAENILGLDVGNTIELIKTRDSAFYDTPLASMLKNHDIATVILCGVSTHTCIFQTASDAYAANLRVILASDAIATHLPKYHKNALTVLEKEYRQRVMSMQQLKNYIQDNCQNNT